MNIPEILPDKYVRKARLSVTILVVLPAALAVSCAIGGIAIDTTTISGKWLSAAVPVGLVGGALLTLAERVARAGRKHEPYLFHQWGGPPLNEALQGRGSDEHRQTWAMIRGYLQSQIDSDLDTDPKSRHLETELKAATKDKKRFPLVFAENCNYGFCRNLWGVKSWGVATSLIAIVVGGGFLLVDWGKPMWSALPMTTVVVGIVAFVLWLFVGKGFVHHAALAYVAAMRNAGTKLLQEARRQGNDAAETTSRSDIA